MPSKAALPLRIHFLRRLNPMLACLLQSPLHGVASQKLLALQYTGRKTGKTFTIPLVYVASAEQIYCVTRDTLWWKSAVDAPSVTIALRGTRMQARAALMPSAAPETRVAFTKFLTENPGTASLLYKVRIGPDGAPDASDLEREIHNSKVIHLAPPPLDN